MQMLNLSSKTDRYPGHRIPHHIKTEKLEKNSNRNY